MKLAEQILSCDDCELVPVEVPEWDCTLYIRTLSPQDVEDVETLDNESEKRGEKFSMATLVKAVCNQDGSTVFTIEQIPALRKKRLSVILRLLQKVNDVNRLDASIVERLEKNS